MNLNNRLASVSMLALACAVTASGADRPIKGADVMNADHFDVSKPLRDITPILYERDHFLDKTERLEPKKFRGSDLVSKAECTRGGSPAAYAKN